MRRYIVLSGEKYFPIINANLGFGRNIIGNTSFVDSICIVKEKDGTIKSSLFHYGIERDIVVDIRKQLTHKEIQKLLTLMNIMGNKAAFDTLFKDN